MAHPSRRQPEHIDLRRDSTRDQTLQFANLDQRQRNRYGGYDHHTRECREHRNHGRHEIGKPRRPIAVNVVTLAIVGAAGSRELGAALHRRP